MNDTRNYWDGYKSVYELNKNELAELKSRYADEMRIDEEEISDDEIRKEYSDTHFVCEDFFCNL